MNLSTPTEPTDCLARNPQKIALLTDSCADLSAEMRAGKPIFVVPLKIRCHDGEFLDGETIFADDIYARQAAGETPQTSLPDGKTIEDTLAAISAAGYEKVIAIHLSSGLSGTYNMMCVAAEEQSDLEIAVFDSLSGSLGIGIMLLQLWEDIQAGMDWSTLTTQRVPHLIANTIPYFSVDTLEHLVKGGRIGKITALAGTMLNIKPIVGFSSDGQLTSVAKVRGRRQVQEKLMELVGEQLKDSHRRYNLAVANGGAQAEMEELAQKAKAAFPDYEHFWYGQLDATLSVYIGDGVLGMGVQFLD